MFSILPHSLHSLLLCCAIFCTILYSLALLELSCNTQERSETALQASAASEETTDQLRRALLELASMREARQRTEDFVRGLVQQRDMYRAMVDEAEALASVSGV